MMQANMNQDYDFNIKSIFGEAWKKIDGFKGTLWAAFALTLLIVGVALIIVTDISNVIEGPANSAESIGGFRPIAEILKLIVSVFITTPLGAGLFVLGIKRSANLPVSYKIIFQYFSYWKTLWIYPVIFSILNILSELLIQSSVASLIIMLITLATAVTLFMFVPLVAEKKLGMKEALEASARTVAKHWFKMLWFIILLAFIAIGSMLTAGIAFIWTLPWMYCAMGILYRNMFGVQKS